MNIEEKARRYDEVREKIAIRFGSNVADEIFSQFEMSDDERISKEIISAIKEDWPGHTEWLAWLEKQCESDETKAKIFLINKGYPIDSNGKLPTYEEMYYIIKDGLEKQDDVNKEYWRGYREGKKEILDKYSEFEKQGEQKPAWSEEDEEHICTISSVLEDRKNQQTEVGIKILDKEIDWLKSLKPQSQWKPSEEQVEALNDVISSRDIKYDVLSELWVQLKKLKE